VLSRGHSYGVKHSYGVMESLGFAVLSTGHSYGVMESFGSRCYREDTPTECGITGIAVLSRGHSLRSVAFPLLTRVGFSEFSHSLVPRVGVDESPLVVFPLLSSRVLCHGPVWLSCRTVFETDSIRGNLAPEAYASKPSPCESA
jgi:hypothetical protein